MAAGRPTRHLSPLLSCYAYCGGHRWHWRQTRDHYPGQPVVILHGLFIPSTTLEALANLIAVWAPVFIPDLPGFGMSAGIQEPLSVPETANSLAEWMKLAGAAPAHVVATSFGCQVAAELATRFPQRLQSLTLVGPTTDPAARSVFSQMGRLLSDIPREPFDLWKTPLSQEMQFSGRAVLSFLEDDIETKLPSAAVPALVLRGHDDPIAPEPWAHRVARLLPDAEAITLNAGAHWVHFSHPRLVAAAVREFTFPLRAG